MEKKSKKHFDKSGLIQREFGNRIGGAQQNVNRIFSNDSIDTKRLVAVNNALNYNFFELYMEKYLNLRQLRHSLGLSQVQLSMEIGIAQGYISELEKGKKQMTDEVLTKIREKYGQDTIEKWIQEIPVIQQTVEGEINNVSGSGDVTAQSADCIPMIAFNKMIEEFAEQRKLISKSQEQIDRLLSLLEKKRD